MRKQIVAGNWKMNKSFGEAEELLYTISTLLSEQRSSDAEVVICPPFLFLELAYDISGEDQQYYIGAQNVNEHESGAYTGEVSAPMLQSLQVDYCIVGHSERRKYYHETDEMVRQKVDQLLKQYITPIVCCGELLPEREKGSHFDIVQKQISKGLFHLDKEDFSNIVIAYEPVWAIGTGVNATPGQAQEMHAFIRKLIFEKYGEETASFTSILYGGSCNAENAKSLFANKDVDGGLIGGASLKAEEFVAIVNSL